MSKNGDRSKAGPDRVGYWRGMVAKWERSGQTPEAFCRQRHVKVGTFGWWRSRLRSSPAGRVSPPVSRGRGFVEVRVGRSLAGTPSPFVYEVELVNGRRVRVGREFDEGTLARLVRTLEGSC